MAFEPDTMLCVQHGATGSASRPHDGPGTVVLWIGSATPANAVTNDLWWDTTNLIEKRYNGTTWDVSGSAAYEPLATSGLLAAKPSTGTGSKVFYFATDDNGGTIYQDLTNGGAYTKVTPGVSSAGKGTITTAKNVTGTVTDSGTSNVTLVNIPFTAVTVAANTADVWLEFEADLIATAAGVADCLLVLNETTSGSDVVVAYSVTPLPLASGRIASFPLRAVPLGAVASTRTFNLQTFFVVVSGSPRYNIVNASGEPTVLTVVAR